MSVWVIAGLLLFCGAPAPASPSEEVAPIGSSEWNRFFNEQGELQVSQRTVMHEIFTKGLHPSVRPAGWEFLMNFHPWYSEEAARSLYKMRREKFYKALNETVVQNPQVMTNKEVVLTRSSINTDVIRTFVVPGKPLCEKKRSELQRVLIATYIYDRVAGYQQGLHEIGMVLQSVMKTECDVFWALRSLLQKTDYTSIIDVGVMKSIKLLEKLIMFLDPKFHTFLYANCKGDLFFLFNWFVLLFLRQMKNNTEVLRLWEVLMTRKPCPRFHVFIALAILQNRKKHLLSLPQDESSIITQACNKINELEAEDLISTACNAYSAFQKANAPENLRRYFGEG